MHHGEPCAKASGPHVFDAIRLELEAFERQERARLKRDAAAVEAALAGGAAEALQFLTSGTAEAHCHPGIKGAQQNIEYLYAVADAAFRVQPDGFSWQALAEVATSALLFWRSEASSLRLLCCFKVLPKQPCKITSAPYFAEFMGAMFGAACRANSILTCPRELAWSVERRSMLLRAAPTFVPACKRLGFLKASLLSPAEFVEAVHAAGDYAALVKFLSTHSAAEMTRMAAIVRDVLQQVTARPEVEKAFNGKCTCVSKDVLMKHRLEDGPARRLLAWSAAQTARAATKKIKNA